VPSKFERVHLLASLVGREGHRLGQLSFPTASRPLIIFRQLVARELLPTCHFAAIATRCFEFGAYHSLRGFSAASRRRVVGFPLGFLGQRPVDFSVTSA